MIEIVLIMKKIFIPVMGMAMLCFFSSCSKETDCCEIEPETTEETKTVTNIDNELLLKLVNDLRIAGCNCGSTAMPPVKPLAWNVNLASAAIGHSEFMASAKVLQHESADGKTVGYRVSATGYNWSNVGENIARGQTSEEQVFKDWLASEPHCKNMMYAVLKDMGAARSGTNWTQIFVSNL